MEVPADPVVLPVLQHLPAPWRRRQRRCNRRTEDPPASMLQLALSSACSLISFVTFSCCRDYSMPGLWYFEVSNSAPVPWQTAQASCPFGTPLPLEPSTAPQPAPTIVHFRSSTWPPWDSKCPLAGSLVWHTPQTAAVAVEAMSSVQTLMSDPWVVLTALAVVRATL